MKKSKELGYSFAVLAVVLVFFAISTIGQRLLGTGQSDSSAENEGLTQDALYKRDIQLCKKVGTQGVYSDSNPRADCVYLLVEKTAVAESICDDPLVKEHLSAQACFTLIAAKQSDGSACEHLNGDAHDSCYSDTARTKNEPSMCRKIVGVAAKDDCLSQLAKSVGDKKLCLEIQVPARRGGCIGQFLNSKEDLKVCDQMSGFEAANCYTTCRGSKTTRRLNAESTSVKRSGSSRGVEMSLAAKSFAMRVKPPCAFLKKIEGVRE